MLVFLTWVHRTDPVPPHLPWLSGGNCRALLPWRFHSRCAHTLYSLRVTPIGPFWRIGREDEGRPTGRISDRRRSSPIKSMTNWSSRAVTVRQVTGRSLYLPKDGDQLVLHSRFRRRFSLPDPCVLTGAGFLQPATNWSSPVTPTSPSRPSTPTLPRYPCSSPAVTPLPPSSANWSFSRHRSSPSPSPRDGDQLVEPSTTGAGFPSPHRSHGRFPPLDRRPTGLIKAYRRRSLHGE